MPSARSLLAGLALGIVLGATARADTVDDLSRKLRSDPDYKVRLSAALNLGKLGDRRGVGALVDALADKDRTVRSVAAGALGKLLLDGVDPTLRDRAMASLYEASRSDSDGVVRDQARRAYDAVAAARPALPPAPPVPPPGPPPLPAGRGVYIDVGPMADTTKRAPAIPAIMRQQVMASLGKNAPQYLLRWPSGKPPSELELQRTSSKAFYVDGSLTALTISKSPPHVSCSISLLLATYPGKSMFAFMKGGAEVDPGSTSDAALSSATTDCVGAVLDDLVGEKLVPTIRSRAP